MLLHGKVEDPNNKPPGGRRCEYAFGMRFRHSAGTLQHLARAWLAAVSAVSAVLGSALVATAGVEQLRAHTPGEQTPGEQTPGELRPDTSNQRASQTPPRIGVFFWHDSPNDEVTFAGVKQGLLDAKVEATFVVRQANSDTELAARQLRELQGMPCDLVLALGTRATQLCQIHLTNVPVVFAAVTNPVTAGIVVDWQNDVPAKAKHSPKQSPAALCGASNWIAPQSVLDVFLLAVPDLKKLGMLRSRDNGVVSVAERSDMVAFLKQDGAPKLTVHEAIVDDASGIEGAVHKLQQQGVDAIWIPIDLTIYQNVERVERALGSDHVPLLTTAAAGVRNGALVGAAVDYNLHGRRAATLVQRVLKTGRVPPGLAVDRMRSSLVVVNLKAAQKNSIELPLSLLALADELIAPEAK
tara:strand:- start:42619 stop:43851 length:1233 start_codon:yes stop_codon:yes gene_type:complete